MDTYNVVFEYTEAAGGFEGVITWTSFASKEEFNRNREQYTNNQKIIAEGVSEDEAVNHVQQTPLSSYIGAALQEATIDGKLHDFIFEMEVANGLSAHFHARHGEKGFFMGANLARRIADLAQKIPRIEGIAKDGAYRKVVQEHLAAVALYDAGDLELGALHQTLDTLLNYEK